MGRRWIAIGDPAMHFCIALASLTTSVVLSHKASIEQRTTCALNLSQTTHLYQLNQIDMGFIELAETATRAVTVLEIVAINAR